MMNETYLRFTEDELRTRFAAVGGSGEPDRHLTYFRNSVAASLALMTGNRKDDARLMRGAFQMQKDERFWIADTLMTLYYRTEDRAEAFSRLMTRALAPGTPPPSAYATWREAFGSHDDLELYFEASLPTTAAYQSWLAANLGTRSLIPWIRDDAMSTKKGRLEGPTKADAVLISRSTHVAVIFEAKVLSDTSVQVGYDAARNQLARTIDVMLEKNRDLQPPLNERNPALTYFVLITPELFKANPETRLYGWLMNAYRGDTRLLAEHLAHRMALPADLPSRLGWVSWEECRELFPETCPWLAP